MQTRSMVLLLIAGAATCGPPVAQARTATTAERIACEAEIRPKLDRIESRLRAGHSMREGESLRAQRRKLEEKMVACRKVK